MAKEKTSEKIVKKRNWAFVLYPESAPEDWKEQLQATGLPIAISPLHDKDIDPTGEPKKAHYHVILCYSGPTSYNVVKAITDSLGQPIPQALENVKGYFRYLSHKDNPGKAQYSEDDIQNLNGFNISDYSELTKSEVFQMKRTIVALIRQQHFTEYSDLIFYLEDTGMYAEMEIASNHTIFFNAILRSCRHSRRVDFETGEILEGGEAHGESTE